VVVVANYYYYYYYDYYYSKCTDPRNVSTKQCGDTSHNHRNKRAGVGVKRNILTEKGAVQNLRPRYTSRSDGPSSRFV